MTWNHNLSDPNRTSFSNPSSHPLSLYLCCKYIPVPSHRNPSVIFINVFSVGHLLISPLRPFPSPPSPKPTLQRGWPRQGKTGGEKGEGNHPVRASQPSIFLSAIPFTLSCSPSLSLPPCPASISVRRAPLSRSHFYPIFSQGWTCCDGSPFSSTSSSQTNITLLSVLHLLLLCLDRISMRVLDHCIPPLSVFQGPSFL